MPELHQALRCAQCKRFFLPTEHHIKIDQVKIASVLDENDNFTVRRDGVQSVNVSDEVVCSNQCLIELVSLKHC